MLGITAAFVVESYLLRVTFQYQEHFHNLPTFKDTFLIDYFPRSNMAELATKMKGLHIPDVDPVSFFSFLPIFASLQTLHGKGDIFKQTTRIS